MFALCSVLHRLLIFCFVYNLLMLCKVNTFWTLRMVVFTCGKNHFEAFISRRCSPSSRVSYWLLQSLQGELSRACIPLELNCACSELPESRDAVSSRWWNLLDSWGMQPEPLACSLAMIQVLQIVKELVTPSRQRAARAKAGRNRSRRHSRSTLRHLEIFMGIDLRSRSYQRGVWVRLCAFVLLMYFGIWRGSGNGIIVNAPHYCCFEIANKKHIILLRGLKREERLWHIRCSRTFLLSASSHNIYFGGEKSNLYNPLLIFKYNVYGRNQKRTSSNSAYSRAEGLLGSYLCE